MSRSALLDEVLEAAESEHVSLEVLAAAPAAAARRRLVTAFASDLGPGERMWEHLNDAAAVRDPDGWRWMAEFLPEVPVLLLFDVDEEAAVLLFSSGSGLLRVLGATTNFEFYVADPDATFLLAFNHHDYLLGAGAARDWVDHRRRST